MFRFAAMSLMILILHVRELHILSLIIIGHRQPKIAFTITIRDLSLSEIDLLKVFLVAFILQGFGIWCRYGIRKGQVWGFGSDRLLAESHMIWNCSVMFSGLFFALRDMKGVFSIELLRVSNFIGSESSWVEGVNQCYAFIDPICKQRSNRTDLYSYWQI